jgi:hypothetical protein
MNLKVSLPKKDGTTAADRTLKTNDAKGQGRACACATCRLGLSYQPMAWFEERPLAVRAFLWKQFYSQTALVAFGHGSGRAKVT